MICECVSLIELFVDNIDQIITTLTYDDKVEVTVQLVTADQQVELYQVSNQLISTTGMVHSPCGVCPVSWICFL